MNQNDKPGFLKQAVQGVGLALAVLGAFLVGGSVFNDDAPSENSIEGVNLSLSNPGRKKPIEGSDIPSTLRSKHKPVVDSASTDSFKKGYEGSGGSKDHPVIEESQTIKRKIMVPKNVENQWKAVKLLIKNEKDEEKNEFKVVELGSSFNIEGTRFKITIGPFLPNFVMNELYYTSMNNQLLNPAVHLIVEEKGEIIYDGWSFTRYPDLYSFSRKNFSIRLTDYIPAEVS